MLNNVLEALDRGQQHIALAILSEYVANKFHYPDSSETVHAFAAEMLFNGISYPASDQTMQLFSLIDEQQSDPYEAIRYIAKRIQTHA